jgi:hypothetical protein
MEPTSSTNAKLAGFNPCRASKSTAGWFVDINSLYPSILTSDLPFSEYEHFVDADIDNTYFKLLRRKLQEGDVDFFWSLFQREDFKFLFKVKLRIQATDQCGKPTTPETWLDLSSFPVREKVNPQQLSRPQRDVARLLRRSVQSR